MSSPSKSLSLSDPEQAGSWAHPSDRGQQVWRMGTQSGVAGTLDGAPPGPDGNLPAYFCLQLFPWGREATPHAVTAADGGIVSAPTFPVAPGSASCLEPAPGHDSGEPIPGQSRGAHMCQLKFLPDVRTGDSGAVEIPFESEP